MKRTVDTELLGWKKDKSRKVLLVRGARQVGKTYSVRELGKTFPHFLEVNFEEEPALKTFFINSLNPFEIIEKLSGYYNISVIPGETLLFFDEIQSCPEALRSLRFFYEKIPELHVIAAGSLLELVISEIPSFGVGRISSLFMYPMCFCEFLMAIEEGGLLSLAQKASFEKPLDNVLHKRLLDKLRIYLVLGGMPAIVKSYCAYKDIRKCQVLLDELIVTIKDDFSKYNKHSPVLKLQQVFQSIAYQTGAKFKYSEISREEPQYKFRDSLDLLVSAGLAYKCYHSSARGIPLGGQVNPKKFKVILFDTGIYMRIVGLDLSHHLIMPDKELINKGALAELFTGLALIAHSSSHMRPQLYYWHREAKSSNAEVDYVVQKNEKIIPVEVKAGTRGQMQSLYIFLDERKLNLGIRVSQENFGLYGKIKTVPLYAAGRIMDTPGEK